MSDSLWRRAGDVFEQAIELDESRQMAFVRQACGADQALLAEVRRMIEADRQTSALLDRPILVWGGATETTIDRGPGAVLPFVYIGNYRLIRKLGEGGMGEVYLAVEEPVNRNVAIKLMRAGLGADYLSRFNDERKALASLNQRNIVTMLASSEIDGRPYFVMEYLDGESLGARMRRGLIPLPEIVEITGQICDALNAAHNRQIVHRDIKPENIFLSRDDDGLLVKILDFGVATLKESDTRTVTDAVVGTAPYLSPEQVMGMNRKEIDGRADIYTLGVVVYEMLTGVLPFTAPNRDGYLHQHLHETPKLPSDRASRAGVTKALDNVVMKALAKDREERYQTAREFARSLKDAAEDPLPASPRKMILSRNVLLSAIVLLLLGAGGWLAFNPFSQSPNMQANLSRTAISPVERHSAPAPGPDLKVELEQKGKGVVSSEVSFKRGDAVRLITSANQSGRIYIVMKGTAGPAEILYPDSRIKGSDMAVQADQRIEAPPSKGKTPWFKFDSQPGVETLYIVFAAQNGSEQLQSLESAILQKKRQLIGAKERQTLAALEALVAGQSGSPAVTAKKILLRHEK